MCKKCSGVHKIVFGGLLLLNAFVWPQWLGIDGWIQWLAVLMVVGGALMFIPHKCPTCSIEAKKKK
jgi:hypothetical protein